MTKTISFNELRRIKDSLPDGSMHKIADKLNVNVQTVRNYFGGTNYAWKKLRLAYRAGPRRRYRSFRRYVDIRYGAGNIKRAKRKINYRNEDFVLWQAKNC